MKFQIQCDFCGKTFERKNSKVKERNYCSRACLGKANAERYRLQSIKTCNNCGKDFEYSGHHKSRNNHFFCCVACGYEFRTTKVYVPCDWCGTPVIRKRSEVERNKHNFCDMDCYQDFINFENAGARNQRIGGKTIYRILAEQKTGKTLTEKENVHHIDGNHANHSSDNLQVVSASEHSRIHASQKRRDDRGRFTK